LSADDLDLVTVFYSGFRSNQVGLDLSLRAIKKPFATRAPDYRKASGLKN